MLYIYALKTVGQTVQTVNLQGVCTVVSYTFYMSADPQPCVNHQVSKASVRQRRADSSEGRSKGKVSLKFCLAVKTRKKCPLSFKHTVTVGGKKKKKHFVYSHMS